ncbi:MAG: hypothetical protein HY773_00400 [Candidatus Terrybacteria bacterium]|nr:hypothetical protein [Candidatus Terrybacteria bacterium]
MKVKIIFGIFILLLVAGAGYYIYRDSTTVVEFEKTQQLKQIQQLEHPNLDRPINMPSTMASDAQKIILEKIEKLSTELKQNPSIFDNWLLLGIYRKIIGDYEGARDCWEYAAVINPQSPTPFNNLGDLYANFIKDNKKAEENFLMAIKIDPSAIYIYRSLYEFYHYNLKDEAKAKQILEQGIKVSPNTTKEFQNLLDNFK